MIGKTNTDLGSIDPTIALGFTVTSYEGQYDGSYHGVTPSVSSAYASSTTFRYSLNGTSWRTSAYTYANPGTYTIYVQALNSTVGNAIKTGTITITPAYVTLTADSLTTKYNRYGNAQTVNTYTCSVAGIRFQGVKASGSGTNVGTYPVTFSGVTKDVTTDTTGKYVVHELVEGLITINKADSSDLGLNVYNYEGDYDGSAHTVTASVSVTNGTTIENRTGSSAWSTIAPTLTNIGELTVQVRATNENFNTATASGTIKIKRPVVTLVVSWESGKVCWCTDPNGNRVFTDTAGSGYWSGEVTVPGVYTAYVPQSSVPSRNSDPVEMGTTRTYYILW